MNIQEDYCSFEISKLLKEKGFDNKVTAFYVKWGDGGIEFFGNCKPAHFNRHQDIVIAAPTHQMAMKWLRKKGIYVYVEPYMIEEKVYYLGRILDKNKMRLHSIENMHSYEKTIDERIKYSLKTLI